MADHRHNRTPAQERERLRQEKVVQTAVGLVDRGMFASAIYVMRGERVWINPRTLRTWVERRDRDPDPRHDLRWRRRRTFALCFDDLTARFDEDP